MAKFGLAHISAGDLLRAEVAAGTAAGMRAKEFMDRGDLVPDEARGPLLFFLRSGRGRAHVVRSGWGLR